jgi:hypothetical protein
LAPGRQDLPNDIGTARLGAPNSFITARNSRGIACRYVLRVPCGCRAAARSNVIHRQAAVRGFRVAAGKPHEIKNKAEMPQRQTLATAAYAMLRIGWAMSF